MTPDALTSRQTLLLVVIGAVFWASGVAYVQIGAFEALGRAVNYLMLVPLTALVIVGARRMTGLAASSTLAGVTVIALTALCLDAATLTFAPAIYTADPLLGRSVAAWLIWAFAVAFALALGWPRQRA